MRVHREFPRSSESVAAAITVGSFDGVHLGHRALVDTVRALAAARQLSAGVLTFTDMPYYFFAPDRCPRLLTLPEEKIAAFSDLSLDDLYLVPFDSAVASQTAEIFVREVLVGRLGMKLLVAGPDFALGKDRQGDIPTLRTLGDELGFAVEVLRHKLSDGGLPISSTRVREFVESGDVATAARLMGRAFTLAGAVVTGRQLGRTIGVPTINLQPHPRKVLPARGVYAARALLGEDPEPQSVALNIGTRPTVSGHGVSVEFHVIGKAVPVAPPAARLELVERLRDERKFADIAALTAQLQLDVARAGEVLRA